MTDPGDRIVLSAMRFDGHHGVSDGERATAQPIEIDVEMTLDLRAAGRSDDLTDTVDYALVFAWCREIVEQRSSRLLEAIAETIASTILERTPIDAVTVRVRKLRVPIDGHLAHAAVEITRRPRPKAPRPGAARTS